MNTPDENGWFTIDSVPEDGTRVLFYDPRRGMREGNKPAGYDLGDWTFKRFSPRKAWWVGRAFDDWYQATHWQPLPKPPIARKTDAG